MERVPASPRFVAALGMLLAVAAILSAIDCRYPQDFWLENVLLLAAAAYVGLTYARIPLSRADYVSILVFLGLHEVGAHTTFAEVPYNEWSRALLGVALNDVLGWERNHYDRLVHLAYGLLIAVPMRHTLETTLGLRGGGAAFVTWMFILATSSAYELIEWAAALVFGGDLGQAYLGTQGDVWDSHKDTGLAILGAALALTIQATLARLTDSGRSRRASVPNAPANAAHCSSNPSSVSDAGR